MVLKARPHPAATHETLCHKILLHLETPLRSKFYDRLRETRDYHRRFPSADLTEPEDDAAALREQPAVEFTGEECGGWCVDLTAQHLAFANARFGRSVDYYT